MSRRSRKSLDETDVAADPGRLELLWLLRGELDDALVEEMAASDGGMCKTENNEALVEILRTGEVPSPLAPDPGEICGLLRWERCEPIAPLTPTQRRHEVMRLFAMWILLNAHAGQNTDRMGYDEDGVELTLVNLTAISVALGPEFVRAAIRFVLWAKCKRAATHDPMDNLFYLLSLFVLRCASKDAEECAAAPAVYDALVTEERQLRRQMSEHQSADWTPGPVWLFGLYNGSYDGLVKSESIQRKWVGTATWVVNHLGPSLSGELDSTLAEFKRHLEEPLL